MDPGGGLPGPGDCDNPSNVCRGLGAEFLWRKLCGSGGGTGGDGGSGSGSDNSSGAGSGSGGSSAPPPVPPRPNYVLSPYDKACLDAERRARLSELDGGSPVQEFMC